MDVRDSQVVCVRCEGSESRLGARRDPAHVACSRHPIIAMHYQAAPAPAPPPAAASRFQGKLSNMDSVFLDP
jgi:hypothetical protein